MNSKLKLMLDETCVDDEHSLLQVFEMPVVEKRKRLNWQQSDRAGRQIVGHWVDDRCAMGDRITLYRQDDKLFIETWFNDGCHSLDELKTKETDAGLRLEDLRGNLFGDYFLLTKEHDLQFCNSEECFYTAKPIAA
ncbi:hypothetical protein LZP69_09775 [Shewanella sp. AS1]|uniref:hypothetical protein n=1 Tax=Shewanella sp. AS1 TaxID=2907626 RepID=UPI001F199898|nr:hypothetical protein [Shewanella sp. AS1]MCE9679449.1 hypothetical protein [Shewanella sp. AS1]